MTGPQGMGPVIPGGGVPGHPGGGYFMDTAIQALAPLSYWKMQGNDALTYHDFGTLAHDLTPVGTPLMTLDYMYGADGFKYPFSGDTTNSYMEAVDDNGYTPSNASGLTICGLVKTKGTNTINKNFLGKANTSSSGEWTASINDTTGVVRALQQSSGTQYSSTTENVLTPGQWNFFCFRFTGATAGFPTVRLNGINCGGTTAGTGTIVANGGEKIKLFGPGLVGASHGEVALAHVAVFAGQLTDVQVKTMEDASLVDGWGWLETGTYSGGAGTSTLVDGSIVRTFNASGTLTVTQPALQEVQVIGCGGGGGSHTASAAGGGGAGGSLRRAVRYTSNQTVTIGVGGVPTPVTGTFAVAGGNCVIGSFTALGGGGGGSTSSWRAGGSGGCGGGGGASIGGAGNGTQGGTGGSGVNPAGNAGGGGGGIGGNGVSGAGTTGGNGGLGLVALDGSYLGIGGAGAGNSNGTQAPQTANSGNGGNAKLVSAGGGETGCTGVAFTRNLSVASTPITVTIDKQSGQADPTFTSPILFDVVFSESVTGFGLDDVNLSGTALPTTIAITGSGSTYVVSVSGMSVYGTVVASIPSGAAKNGSGTRNVASTSTDNSVLWQPLVAPATTQQITDDFNRADGAIGGIWTSSGNWAIVSNQASVTSSTGNNFHMSGPVVTANDQFAQVTVHNLGSDVAKRAGIEIRSPNASNFYAGVVAATGYSILERNSNTYTTKTSVSLTPSFPVNLRMEIIGTTMRLFANGLFVLEHTDPTFTTDKGVGVLGSIGCVVDDFSAGTIP